MHWIQYLQAFLEGVTLIVSPCILPILPLVLGSAMAGDTVRPYGVIIGFVLAFSLLALFSRQLVALLGIDVEWLHRIAYGLLLLFGLVLLLPVLSNRFSDLTQRLADWGSRLSRRPEQAGQTGGFLSGLWLGMCIGLIWTPCAGPILAAVLVQTILQQTDRSGALMIVLFALGAGLPMLLIAKGGRHVIQSLSFFRNHSLAVRRALGLVVIATVLVSLIQSMDFSAAGKLPGKLSEAASSANAGILMEGLPSPYPAPELKGIAHWINSPPLTMAGLKGKVVLVDFWTYSCINCLRTLPYLKSWDSKYRPQGLMILGVHAPEFAFERSLANVEAAVQRQGIVYPVALDNQLATWQAFQNHYWPAHYLIDRQGRVVYTHFGEGGYEATEQNIRTLLGVNGSNTKIRPAKGEAGIGQTPETYLGYARAERFEGTPVLKPGLTQYTLPEYAPVHAWALKGSWQVGSENITSVAAGTFLRLNFYARKVFLVLGSKTGQPISAVLLLNGKPLTKGLGEDVAHGGVLTVKRHTLYELISLPSRTNAQLDILPQGPGLEAYAFTFSS